MVTMTPISAIYCKFHIPVLELSINPVFGTDHFMCLSTLVTSVLQLRGNYSLIMTQMDQGIFRWILLIQHQMKLPENSISWHNVTNSSQQLINYSHKVCNTENLKHKILAGKILTIQPQIHHTFIKFITIFQHQKFALRGIVLMLSLGHTVISDFLIADLFMHLLSCMILLYAPFFTLKVFLNEIQ